MRWDNILYRRTVLNYFLYPLSLLYAGIMLLRRGCYHTRLLKVYYPEVKTLSVGNITSGGSGKTPFTIYLAKMLQNDGFRVAVSHRDYKGKLEHTNRIIADQQGIRKEASKAGDEAYLLAGKLSGIPVVTGKNRTRSIKMLQKEFPDLDFIILDDSFQHLKVKKHFDFVLFNSLTGLGNGFVLPAGILREPIGSLRFADCLVYTGEGEIPVKLRETGKKIIRTLYRISKLYLPGGEIIEIQALKGKKLALISGIGQPRSFEQLLKANGIVFGKHFRFPDHYNYQNDKVIKKINQEVRDGYDFLLTTEKDYTKLQRYSSLFPFVIVAIEIYTEEHEVLLSMLKEIKD